MIVGGKPLNVTSVTFVFTSSSCNPTRVPRTINYDWVSSRWDNSTTPATFTSLSRQHDVSISGVAGQSPPPVPILATPGPSAPEPLPRRAFRLPACDLSRNVRTCVA